jgi:hypothetical protein
MPLKVIGAGLGRTGTLSLKLALEQLGFDRCYHMAELLQDPARSHFWEKALDGEPVDWEAMFEGYQATVDWPGCSIYGRLVEAFPDAKVILSVRDPESWFVSTQETIFNDAMEQMQRQGAQWPAVEKAVYEFCDWKMHDRAHLLALLERHNAEVRRTIPPERLLIYEAKQGWEPLCRFLDVPVPDTPYPRVNTREEFRARAAQFIQPDAS